MQNLKQKFDLFTKNEHKAQLSRIPEIFNCGNKQRRLDYDFGNKRQKPDVTKPGKREHES